MLFMMFVSLYTSRIILNALGVEDYGVYNVVGGLVSMFTMISGALSTSISRFLTYELGKKSQQKLNLIFSTSVIIQLVISAIIFILVEIGGLWFLSNKMVIPLDRLFAAKCVLHLSLFTLVINIISIPYNAVIIAHEKMKAFAYISILETVLKLAVAYTIMYFSFGDNLILYSVLMCFIAIAIRIIYITYCKRNFEECRVSLFSFDKELLKEMFGFAGWSFIGAAAQLLRDQGGNILLNLFGGPAVNAARAISFQVRSAVTSFSTNFMTALKPQITKSYANGDLNYMFTLIFQGTRISYYMLLLLSIPVLLNTEYLLSVWLGEVPTHTILFVKLGLILGLIESLSTTLVTAAAATGKIKNYQLVVGGLYILNLPISYLLLRNDFFPEVIIIVAICLAICCLFSRIYMLKDMINFPTVLFLRRVLLKVSIVSFISIAIPYIIYINVEQNIFSFFLTSIISVLCTTICIYFIGCSNDEKLLLKQKINQLIIKAKV